MEILIPRQMLLGALSCLLCACASSGTVPAKLAAPIDPEAQARRTLYDKDFDRFYYLEQQGFKEISCRVESPTMDKMMQSVRGMLAPLTDKVTVTDTLADYHLTYKKEGGLQIEDPSADIVPKSGVKAVDPAKAEQGRAQFQNGFKAMITGIDSEIRTIFGVITESDRNNIDVLYVTDTPDGFSTGYTEKKSNTQGAFSLAGDVGTVKASFPMGGSMTAIQHFAPTRANKLLLQDMQVDFEQSGTKGNTTLAIAYQDFGLVKFPQKISVKGSMDSLQAAHMDVAFDILLNDCNLQ